MNKTTALSLLMLFSASSELMARHSRTLTITNALQGTVRILEKNHAQPNNAGREVLRIAALPFDDASNYADRMTKPITAYDGMDYFVQYHEIVNGVDTVVEYQIPDCAIHFIVPTNVISDKTLSVSNKQKDVLLDKVCVANKRLEAQAKEKLAQAE